MSEPKDLQRYEAVIPWEGEMQPHGDGEYVRYDDIAPFVADIRSQLAAAQQERSEADEALAACQAQASGEIARLTTQLAAMTEARDIWQREAEMQRQHRESAERERDALRRIIDATAEGAGFAKTYDPSTLPSAVGHLRHRAERLGQQLDAGGERCVKSMS